jgi:hypothetical protein
MDLLNMIVVIAVAAASMLLVFLAAKRRERRRRAIQDRMIADLPLHDWRAFKSLQGNLSPDECETHLRELILQRRLKLRVWPRFSHEDRAFIAKQLKSGILTSTMLRTQLQFRPKQPPLPSLEEATSASVGSERTCSA